MTAWGAKLTWVTAGANVRFPPKADIPLFGMGVHAANVRYGRFAVIAARLNERPLSRIGAEKQPGRFPPIVDDRASLLNDQALRDAAVFRRRILLR